MDNIRNSQIASVIDALSRVMSVDSSRVDERLKQYSTMSDKDVIKDLSTIVYNNFKDEEELFTYFLSLIRNINPVLVPSVDYMKNELEKMYFNKNENMDLEENHRLVMDSLKQLAGTFNKEEIDYCVVGALPCFLQTGIGLFRHHDDIDIMINEEDIEKVKSIMEGYGYIFKDLRFPNADEFHDMKQNKPPHLVMAQNPYNEFHIGFFTFRREKDNSIIVTEYMPRENNGEIFVDRLERGYTPLGASLRYNNTMNIEGINIRTCSIEDVYNLKSYTRRPKDITDMAILEDYIDKAKLKELRRNTNTRQIIKNVSKEEKMVM